MTARLLKPTVAELEMAIISIPEEYAEGILDRKEIKIGMSLVGWTQIEAENGVSNAGRLDTWPTSVEAQTGQICAGDAGKKVTKVTPAMKNSGV